MSAPDVIAIAARAGYGELLAIRDALASLKTRVTAERERLDTEYGNPTAWRAPACVDAMDDALTSIESIEVELRSMAQALDEAEFQTEVREAV